MAVTAINIAQSNITGESNLLSVHNPLIFLVNATFTGAAPEKVYCEIYDSDSELLGTFKCIPYVDLTTTLRQFMIVVDTLLRGYMGVFDDFVQSGGSLDFVEDITKEFTLTFTDDLGAYEDSVNIVVIHAVRQFGDDPSMDDIFNNEAKTYYGYENTPIYLYIYNDDENNFIGSDEGESGYAYALDYDDSIFTDTVDDPFTIKV